jgi:glycosyltransferase involved in cell wall biosynthesis
MITAAFVIPGDITLATGGYVYDRRIMAAIPSHGVELRHLAVPGSFPNPSEEDLAETARLLAREPGDRVLFVDGLALGAMPASLLDTLRQPIVALCHHPLALEVGLAAERAAELKALETAALRRARHVVVTSPMTRRILAADFGVPADKITVAEPGTDPAKRSLRPVGAPVPQQGPLHLLAVGSVVPRKGYDVLVKALIGLRDRSWLLTIAGPFDRSPETTAALRAAVAAAGLSDRFRLVGAVGTAELDRLYGEADIFVMPSLFEGYGMVIAEAMARGLPIVCTTGGAAAETAPDRAALKVPPGDAAAFGDALRRVCDDAGLRAAMADAAWEAGKRLPRWSDTARVIAEVIRRVAS